MTAFFALIPAAGTGSRVGADQPKQYLPLAGRPVLSHVLDTFASSGVAHTYLVVSPQDRQAVALLAEWRARHARQTARVGAADDAPSRITLVAGGGASRRETVRNGLAAMRPQVADDDWVLVHDAARPGLTAALLAHLSTTLADDPVGGLLALPVVDTVKRADAEGRSSATVARDGLWLAQTPQMFRYRLLCEALAQEGAFTDEASAVEALGLRPKLVTGSPDNFKITVAADLSAAEVLFARRAAEMAPHDSASPHLPVAKTIS